MEIYTHVNIPGDIQEHLSSIIVSPLMYPDFPKIPPGIFSSSGVLHHPYSLYKKGTAYYVIQDGKGEYREGIEVLDVTNIVFSFTQFELESPHVGKMIRNRVIDTTQSQEIQVFEEALKTVIFKKLYNSLAGYFGDTLSNKLYELSGLTGDTDFSYLVGISLIPLGGHFIVLDTEIDFSRQELEQIKRAVFI